MRMEVNGPTLAETRAQKPKKSLIEALAPLVNIAKAYMENGLDDEARRFWGPNTSTESENNRDPKSIELYTGRGGTQLLTLQDCFDARDAVAEAGGRRFPTESLLKEASAFAPTGCHCLGTCGAPVIMGRQTPCRRPGGVPGMPAPAAPVTLLGEVSRDVADGISGATGAIATADARASGQQIPKKPQRYSADEHGPFKDEGADYFTADIDDLVAQHYGRVQVFHKDKDIAKAQALRLADLMNADNSFDWSNG